MSPFFARLTAVYSASQIAGFFAQPGDLRFEVFELFHQRLEPPICRLVAAIKSINKFNNNFFERLQFGRDEFLKKTPHAGDQGQDHRDR